MSDKAYSTLAKLEALSKSRAANLPEMQAIKETWSGVAFRIGETLFVASMADVSEVIPVPAFTIVPGVKSWVRGVANVRGRLLPIMDLGGFLNVDRQDENFNQRILVIDREDMYSGLVVDEVLGMQHFDVNGFELNAKTEQELIDAYVDGAYTRDEHSWYVFKVLDLVENPDFLQAAV